MLPKVLSKDALSKWLLDIVGTVITSTPAVKPELPVANDFAILEVLAASWLLSCVVSGVGELPPVVLLFTTPSGVLTVHV